MLDYSKLHRNSDDMSINTSYIQEAGARRIEYLQDLARLQALKELRDVYYKKQAIIDKYGEDEWQEHIPEGYAIFNPLRGDFILTDKKLTERFLNIAIETYAKQAGFSEVQKNKIRDMVSDNNEAHLMVLPTELVNTLNKMGTTIHRGNLYKTAKSILKMWKYTALYSPTRTIKFNFRNFTGDLDVVMAGNPTALLKFTQAHSELKAYYYKEGKTTDELKEFQKRGGAITIGSVQEFYNDKEMREFDKLISELQRQEKFSWKQIPSKVWHLYDKILGSKIVKFSEYREQWLRYATYLDYLEQMQKNKDGMPNNFGASVREEVMNIPDVRDRAFKLANELIGAYDQVSQSGKELRDFLIAFYSFIEVNAKRYWQLFKNGLKDNPKDFMGNFLKGQLFNVPYYGWKLAKFYFFINLFAACIKLWNWLFDWFTGAEDDLPPDIQGRPHMIFGHDPITGNVLYFDGVGSLLDFMEWFGQSDTFFPFYQDAKNILNGRQTFGNFAAKIGSSAYNKIINSFSPITKWPLELGSAQSYYPSVTRPRNVRDVWKYVAQSLGLQWPYKAITSEPRSDWHELKNLFLYDTDADQAAYFYTLGKVREFQEKVLERRFDGFMTTPRGEALRDLRTALRYDNKDAIKRSLEQYYSLNGKNQGLKTSLRNMYPLHSLNKNEQQMFLEWLSPEDRKFLNRANKYYETILNRLD